jgi:hypothetical protein
MAPVSVAERVRSRISFAVAPDGTRVARLIRVGDGPLTVQTWTFAGSTVERRTLRTRPGGTTSTRPLCMADGRVLFTRPGPGHHRVVLAEPTADGLVERPLVTIDCAAVRLLALAGRRAFAVGRTAGGRTLIWRIVARAPGLELVADLPGPLRGGHPLDTGGSVVGFNQQHKGSVRPVAVDLRTGAAEPVAGTVSGQRLLLSAPRSGLLLLAGTVGGIPRLGHASEHVAPRFPDVLDALDGVVAPLAVDPLGEHVALRVDRGARSHLVLYTPRGERVRAIDTPPGIIHTACGWGPDGLRFPFSAPHQPGGIATVDPTTGTWEWIRSTGYAAPRP